MTGRALTPAERDEQGLLAALLRDLSDPLARAAYCDWLEENDFLAGREPSLRSGTWPIGTPLAGWYCPGTEWAPRHVRCALPYPLFALLKGGKEPTPGWLHYDVREDALEALRGAAAELRNPATR